MAAATGSDVHATSPRDSLTGVAARSVPMTCAHPLLLPTPPNSISPALPPHGLTAQLHKAGIAAAGKAGQPGKAARLDPVDSDLDLQDVEPARHCLSALAAAAAATGGLSATEAAEAAPVGVNHTATNSGRACSPPYESADSITPAMLAKYHLPEILLQHGPLAIRYIVGHLTASVPGFSTIPPAKSRRLVVAALEGRGSGGEGGLGGLEGDVEFDKVSWGVWNARRVGRQRLSAPTAATAVLGIPIASGSVEARPHKTATTATTTTTTTDDDDGSHMMMDDEVDNMSMDGSASASCSDAPDAPLDADDVPMNDDPDNMTDDEDWGAVGAAALRAASYSGNAAAGRFGSSLFAAQPAYYPGFSFDGAATRLQRLSAALNPGDGSRRGSTVPDASEEQERDAVEALLRLGSV